MKDGKLKDENNELNNSQEIMSSSFIRDSREKKGRRNLIIFISFN